MDQQTPNSTTDAIPGAGHNQPDPVATLQAYLEATYADLDDRVKAIEDTLPNIVKITDQKRADELTDYAKKQVIALQDEIGKTMRVKEKEPFLKAGKAVDEFFNPFVKRLEPVVAQLRAVVTAWNHEQDEIAQKKARDEAAAKLKAAQEAADKNAVKAAKAEMAAAADVRAGGTHGTHGATSSNRKVWKHRIIKADKIPREFCEPSDALIKAAMKAAGDNVGKLKIAGVEFYQAEDAQFRK